MIERRKVWLLLMLWVVGLCRLLLAIHRSAFGFMGVLQPVLAGICFGICLPTLLRGIQVGAMNKRSRTSPVLFMGVLNVYFATRYLENGQLGAVLDLMISGLFIGIGIIGFAALAGKVHLPVEPADRSLRITP